MTDPTFNFDGAFLRRLERLAVLNRRPLRGPYAGPRRSPRHGASVEFADFRTYAVGDDLRHVDWSAYARLDRLFVRLYQAEEMAILTILLDHSRSMQFGRPSKLLTAGRLAAIVSYIALHTYDSVAVAGWGDGIDQYLPGQSGKKAIPQVWRTIARLVDTPSPATDFGSLHRFGAYRRGPGIAVVLSDFLTESDWRAGLRGLRAAGQEVTAVQVLAPEELEPTIRGDWRLRDVETDAETEVTLSPRVLRRYRDELEAHTAALMDFTRREGVAFVQLRSDADLATTALSSLQTVGVLG